MKPLVWIIGANSDIAKAFMQMNSQYRYIMASRNVLELEKWHSSNFEIEGEVQFLDLEKTENVDKFVKSNKIPYGILYFAGKLEMADNIEEIYLVNVMEAIKITQAVLPDMVSRKNGFIVGVSSIAGDRGKASNPIYSSSKAALTSYFQALMQKTGSSNICVLNIKPGFVRTKMLKDSKKMPNRILVCEAKDVALAITDGIAKGKSREIYVKPMWRFIMWIYKMLPICIYNKLKL